VSRPSPEQAKVVGIVGAGLIGAGWTAYFLARGYDVAVYDPAPDAQQRLLDQVAQVWPVMRRAGLVMADPPAAPVFGAVAEVAARADFILENGPEKVALKRELLRDIDAAARPGVVIASSSSALLPSDYQDLAADPSRILGAHPFNPPALVPLVEIVGGRLTDPAAVAWAMDFFRHAGKRPVEVRLEQPGFLANRMASALYREAVDLVARGVASVADVDAAICNGPGLRWAVMGPHMLYHLGGGPGGYASYLEHLGASQETRWASLGSTPLTPDVKAQLVAGVKAELDALKLTDAAATRDAALAAVMAALDGLS
jgi:carnitine 3-dehydrogenase